MLKQNKNRIFFLQYLDKRQVKRKKISIYNNKKQSISEFQKKLIKKNSENWLKQRSNANLKILFHDCLINK